MFDDFDHPLKWDCEHAWVNKGQPMAHYTSDGTSTMPPSTAYSVVRAQCQLCCGIGITVYDPRNDVVARPGLEPGNVNFKGSLPTVSTGL